MKYRELGKDKVKVSQLGFGCMRFPIIGDDTKNIDVEATTEMLKYAVKNGVNYVDTAFPYHGEMSEIVVGEILNKENLRDKVHLVSKLSIWLIDDSDKMEEFLDNQLKRSQQSYFDFYLIHALNKENWDKAKSFNVLQFLDKAKKSGKIKYTGFSFHDESLDVFKDIVDSYDWDMVQIQYNYLDEYYQAGREGLEYCESKGIGCVIMEPLKGGSLVRNLPSKAIETFKESNSEASIASWAIKWLLNQKNVKVVLSGMSALEEVRDNIKSASEFTTDCLGKEEEKAIKSVVKIINNTKRIECTNCEYCQPCPHGVLIPKNFNYYNDFLSSPLRDHRDSVRENYRLHITGEERSDACVDCGICETNCPQNLKIRDLLKEVTKTLIE